MEKNGNDEPTLDNNSVQQPEINENNSTTASIVEDVTEIKPTEQPKCDKEEKVNERTPLLHDRKTKGKSPTTFQKEVNRAASATPPPRENTPQPVLAPPTLGKVHKPTRGKREDKEMRKDIRLLEDLQKSSDDHVLGNIIKKYQSMYDELKKNETTIADWQASFTQMRRERDAMNSENQRLLMRVGKTEALCRLQQQQNKQTKDEYVAKLREEQDKRKEVTCKLHETLKQLDVVLNENSARSSKLHEDNIDMSQKLSRLHQQINKRSEETRNAEKQLELQKQLYTTEISKNRLEHEAEKEIYMRQAELLQYQLQEKETEIKIQKNELATMESRVDEYIKKYADIEPFISQSSKLFETYKSKIEKMNSTNTSLEAEVFEWQKKYNDCMRTVVDLTLAIKLKEKDVGHLDRKLERLQNLCRQLQTDRSNFLKQLKAAGLEPGEAPTEAPTQTLKEKEEEIVHFLSEQLSQNQEGNAKGSEKAEEIKKDTGERTKTEDISQTEAPIEPSNIEKEPNDDGVAKIEPVESKEIVNEKPEDPAVVDNTGKDEKVAENNSQEVTFSCDSVLEVNGDIESHSQGNQN